MLCGLYLLFSFYSPDSSMFSDDSFLCEKRRGLLRALPWNILLVLNSDFYFFTFLFSKLALGPILLMMINVSINDD